MQKKTSTFTLVPAGGLGNRISAICSAISFCMEKQRHLTIIWFKDKGLNCDYDKLFHLDAPIDVKIHNAKSLDFLLRDKPRKGNLWIPRFFECTMYNKCIYYWGNDFEAQSDSNPMNDIRLDSFPKIYMMGCSIYWENPAMFQWIKPCPEIKNITNEIVDSFPENIVGLHIRRTDSIYAIEHNPTEMFITAIESEIQRDPSVKFYLASDSMEEKEHLLHLYGNRIITSRRKVVRNTETGIIDAFVEMNVLSRTNKIYASNSTFSHIAARLSGTNVIFLNKEL
ncbi:MAG: hypothetical protein LBR97_04400 [Dysgonamonadaceae bacterium]|jgi:hypothetical protein|nr:hypothetical protein [Dysgonamonadaceae bacterium]